MKLLKLNQIFCNKSYLLTISCRWGSISNLEIISYYNNFLIIDLKSLFLRLKKIVCIVNEISFNQGVCLVFFLDIFKKKYFNELCNFNVNNFYIAFINKMFGFLSNFFLLKKLFFNLNKFTNYNSYRFPSIVFLTKKSWKVFNQFFRVFLQLRIISIKSNSYLDFDQTISLNILIRDCDDIYLLLKSIYILNNEYIKIW